MDAENEEDEDDKGMEAKSGGRAGTAGSERMEEGIVADEVEEKEAVVNSLESSLASSSDFKKVRCKLMTGAVLSTYFVFCHYRLVSTADPTCKGQRFFPLKINHTSGISG